MGGRGSTSQLKRRMPQPPQQQTTQNPITQQPPTPDNTPVVNGALTALSQMSDDQLATLMANSKTVDMPNHLNDAVDATQKFAYTAGVNEMPTVLDDAAFDQFLKDNNIPRSNILARSVSGTSYNAGGIKFSLSATDITDMMKYSALNYVGGKHGGQVYGAGTYFDMNGGRNTGYASGATALAVLNPQTARCMQSLKAIVIDPVRCPATNKEFTTYEYERTEDGEIISGYPDKDNHSIDSVRYAMERVWKRKGQ